MHMDIKKLYEKLKSMDDKEFYKIESDFFIYLYSDPNKSSLPFVNTFLIVSSWFGTSMRSGVWTFYETANEQNVKNAVDYLKQTGETELAAIIEKGIHDYQNPIYSENFDYPEKWISEADEIDDWITEQESRLSNWLYNFLIANEDKIISL